MSIRYAFLGPEGTFTHEALLTLPEADAGILLPAETISTALEWVCRDEVDAAMVPFRNSIAGPVDETVAHLKFSDPYLEVVREVKMRVAFSLLTRARCEMEEIRTLAGHPHSFPQTCHWLNTHLPHAQWHSVNSNADAARRVAAGEFDAALAGEGAAQRWRLCTLAHGIGHSEAVTTFILVNARHSLISQATPLRSDGAAGMKIRSSVATRPVK